MLGIGLSLTGRLRSSVSIFSPISLFSSNEPGIWLDPSDLTTLFQDTAGTLPVTTPGQTVALALDKSKGLALGPELVTNGDFSDGSTGWTPQMGWTIGSGIASVNSAAAGTANLNSTSVVVVAGKTYQITYTILSVSGSGIRATIGGVPEAIFRTTAGTFTVLLTASSTASFGLTAASTNTVGTVDNISVRELPGNHATQATLASRPTFQVEYNGTGPLGPELVTNGDFSSGTGWTLQSGWTIGSGVLSGNVAAAAFANAGTSVSFVAGRTYQITFTITSYTSGAVRPRISGGTDVFSSIDRSSVGTFTDILVAVSGNNTINMQARSAGFVGTIDNISVKELPAESWRPYLKFDGVDDFMITPTITPGIDKVQVFAGVRKLSDAARGVVVELGPPTVSGSFGVNAPTGAFANYGFNSFGTAGVFANSPATFEAPDSAVLTGQGEISTDTATLRRNGTQIATSASDQGTGNYSAAPIYIGRRGGTVSPFNGQLYSLIVRLGTNLDAGTITSTETWVNDKTGAYA